MGRRREGKRRGGRRSEREKRKAVDLLINDNCPRTCVMNRGATVWFEFLAFVIPHNHSYMCPPPSNRAECYLKTHQPRKAVRDCNKALAMNPLNLKARWRRSNAWQNIGMKYPAALDLL